MKKTLLVFTLIMTAPLMAQQFILVSFNTLHYGWGPNTNIKDQAIVQSWQFAHADAMVLQEFMPQATFAGLVRAPPNRPNCMLCFLRARSISSSHRTRLA